jgi:predicted transcriptional regulator
MLIREKPRVYLDPDLKKRLNVLAAQRETSQNAVLELALKIGLDSLEEVAV